MNTARKDKEGLTICPQCGKHYEPELPERDPLDRRPIQKIYPGTEPYQKEQLKTGLCSDKCWDNHIGVKHKYTYDEKGRRFKDGNRLLFAEPPKE